MTILQATTIAAALVYGVLLATLAGLKRRPDGGRARRLWALNAALVPLTLLAGGLIDGLGPRLVLVGGSFVAALGVAGLGLAPDGDGRRAFGSLLLAGFGAACLGAAALVLTPHAFFGVERLASASLNLGCVFIALGALVTPVLSDVLMRRLDFRRTAALLAVLCLAPALLAALPGQTPAAAPHGSESGPLLGSADVWLVALVFLFYAPLEASVSVWTTAYLTDGGRDGRAAAWMLSAFWTAFVASRLLTAMLLHWAAAPWGEPWLLVAAGVGAAAVIGNLVATGSRASARPSLVLLGLLLGPVFPMAVSLAFWSAPAAPGTAYGVVYAAGSLGSLALAPLVGGRRAGLQDALRVPMLLALALSASALVFAVTR